MFFQIWIGEMKAFLGGLKGVCVCSCCKMKLSDSLHVVFPPQVVSALTVAHR